MKPLSDDEELLRMLRLPEDQVAAAKSALSAAQAEAQAAPKRRVTGAFAVVELEPLKIAAKAVSDMGSGALMVWFYLVYEARFKRTNTVRVSNVALSEWGVTRWREYRILKRFEAAGLIRILRSNGGSLRVTLLPAAHP
jgi:hypothetical protein